MIEVEREYKADRDQALGYIKEIIEKISPTFTKTYLQITDSMTSENHYTLSIQFYEPKTKQPVSSQKVTLNFKIPRNLDDKELSFQIENESVFYPVFSSININYFENLLYRVMNNKEKMTQKLLLHSNFESSRILKLNGDQVKLYTIEEDEDILSNNEGEFFNTILVEFKPLDLNEIVNLIKILWKTLCLNETSNSITLKEFMLLFDYGKLNFSNENLNKLWKYTDINKKDSITYPEFSIFCIDLIQCLRAYHIAFYKHENNTHLQNKISSCVEIMNLHFKEYDYEGNGEITFENLKKCLLKENELFSRKEIEILLKQINPDKNFEYWKFDRILKILYLDNFNYSGLMKEDKIYRYLIHIFEKQDTLKTKKLHYKKMKYALLIEDKLKLNKVQIMVILNFFNINVHPEIDYYKASLIIRDIIAELFSSEMSIQKIDITGENYQTYENFQDVYNEHSKNIKNNFINFDKDFDHLLSIEEFKDFLNWLIPHIDDSDKVEIFRFCDTNKDEKINYTEFKEHFPSLMNMTRIKNVFKIIGDIINEAKQ